MKIAKMFRIFSIALLAIVLASLVGCAKQEFKPIGQPIVIGDKTYVAVVAKDRDPWGHDNSTVILTESTSSVPQTSGQRVADVTYSSPCNGTTVVNSQQQVQPGQYIQYAQAEQTELIKTRVINTNNQGGPGWINNSAGGAFMGAGIAGAGALIRPSHTNVYAGDSSATSSSNASANINGGGRPICR